MTPARFITLTGGAVTMVIGALVAKVGPPMQPAKRNALPGTTGRTFGESLAHSLRSETGPKRWLRLLAATERAGASEMPELIHAFGEDSAAVRVLAARWAEIDPAHMFRTLSAEYSQPQVSPEAPSRRIQLMVALFEQWAKSDAAAAVAALRHGPDFFDRGVCRVIAANALVENDVEAGLRVMEEWGVRFNFRVTKQFVEWVTRDPQNATQTILKTTESFVRKEALTEVAKVWSELDPASGARFAATLAPADRTILGGEIMRVWATHDAKAAIAFATTQPEGAWRNALGQGLVAEWGRTDAAAALAWSGENLRGPARTEAISTLIKVAAEKDLVGAANLVATMEPGAAQNRASASIFETWFEKGESERAAALDWLASLSAPAIRRAALERVQWDWLWKDPDGVRDFISGPNGALASPSLLQQVARGEVSKNPETAMQWANDLPADRAARARAAVLESWLAIRPDAVTDYARKLPAGDERDQALRTISQALIFQSPSLAAAWYRTLDEAGRKVAREIFDRSSLTPEQRRQLEDGLK